MGATLLVSTDLPGAGPHQSNLSPPGSMRWVLCLCLLGTPGFHLLPSKLLSQSPQIPLALLRWSCPILQLHTGLPPVYS